MDLGLLVGLGLGVGIALAYILVFKLGFTYKDYETTVVWVSYGFVFGGGLVGGAIAGWLATR